MGLIVNAGILLVTALVLAIGWLWIFYQKKFKHWSDRNVEHTNPSFLFGDLKGIGTSRGLAQIVKENYDQHSTARYFGGWSFYMPTLNIIDPDLIRHVLVSDFMSFHDRGVYNNEEADPLSASIFSLEGAKWRNLRVKLTPTFTSGKMKMMFPIMTECGEELEQLLLDYAETGNVVEVKEVTARYSTDIIASVAFGIQTNSLKNEDSVFRTMGRRIFQPSVRQILYGGLAVFAPQLAKRLNLRIFPDDISSFFMGTVKETMEYREKNNVQRNDMMQLLIELKNKGYVEDVDSKHKGQQTEITGEKFTFEQAAAQAFIFFLGGFETSSGTLQFAMLELALNQQIQNKLRNEITTVLAKHNNQVTYEGVQEMNYLGQVIDETLRKYPAQGAVGRKCNKDYQIPDSDLVIEKDTMVGIPVYGLHMDERYFPDPEVFDPDRFSEEEKKKRHKYVYLPFGEGPRICIGQRFGLLQIRVALVHILRKFKFDVSREHTTLPIVFDPKAFGFSPKGGIHLKVSLFKE